MNPKGLKSTGYAVIFSKEVQERSNTISSPEYLVGIVKTVWWNCERWVKKQMPNLKPQLMLEKRWGNAQDKLT